jgi:hypothetical protein
MLSWLISRKRLPCHFLRDRIQAYLAVFSPVAIFATITAQPTNISRSFLALRTLWHVYVPCGIKPNRPDKARIVMSSSILRFCTFLWSNIAFVHLKINSRPIGSKPAIAPYGLVLVSRLNLQKTVNPAGHFF